ncbi:MAG: hypothetical protein KDA85_01820, partial [Planctomycetaceae bacterium]|nr:hypothetical protein [Planctomycetaceae bacterium]
ALMAAESYVKAEFSYNEAKEKYNEAANNLKVSQREAETIARIKQQLDDMDLDDFVRGIDTLEKAVQSSTEEKKTATLALAGLDVKESMNFDVENCQGTGWIFVFADVGLDSDAWGIVRGKRNAVPFGAFSIDQRSSTNLAAGSFVMPVKKGDSYTIELEGDIKMSDVKIWSVGTGW